MPILAIPVSLKMVERSLNSQDFYIWIRATWGGGGLNNYFQALVTV